MSCGIVLSCLLCTTLLLPNLLQVEDSRPAVCHQPAWRHQLPRNYNLGRVTQTVVHRLRSSQAFRWNFGSFQPFWKIFFYHLYFFYLSLFCFVLFCKTYWSRTFLVFCQSVPCRSRQPVHLTVGDLHSKRGCSRQGGTGRVWAGVEQRETPPVRRTLPMDAAVTWPVCLVLWAIDQVVISETGWPEAGWPCPLARNRPKLFHW